MTVTNFPKVSGWPPDEAVQLVGQNVTNYPLITGVGGGASRRLLNDEITQTKLASYDFDPMSAAWTTATATVETGDGDVAVISRAQMIALIMAGDCFLIDVKDQSGGGFDISEATARPQLFLDEWGYPYADCVGGDFLRSASFFGAQANVSMTLLWTVPSNRAGSPGMQTFHGGFDFAGGSGGAIVSPWWQKNQSPSLGTNGFSAFDWIDNRPRFHGFNWDTDVEKIYEFGCYEGNPNSTTNPTYARFTIGKNDFQAGNLRFYGFCGFFSGAIDFNLATEVIKNNMPLMFVVDEAKFTLGDSNTACGFVDIGRQWTRKLFDGISFTGWIFGRAIGGKTLQNAIDRLPEIEKMFDLFTFTSVDFIIHLATNDIEIDNKLGAEALALQATLVAGLRDIADSRGVGNNVASTTCLPRTGDLAFNGSRAVYNTGLKANAGGIYGDIIIDTTAVPALEDQNDPVNFVDTTHLSATGQTELANLMIAAF
jgi:hypothetical protein